MIHTNLDSKVLFLSSPFLGNLMSITVWIQSAAWHGALTFPIKAAQTIGGTMTNLKLLLKLTWFVGYLKVKHLECQTNSCVVSSPRSLIQYTQYPTRLTTQLLNPRTGAKTNWTLAQHGSATHKIIHHNCSYFKVVIGLDGESCWARHGLPSWHSFGCFKCCY